MLESKIEELWKNAVLSRSDERHIYSTIRAEIKNETIKLPWPKRPIKDDAIIALIRRLIKQRNETLELIKDSKRQDAVDKEMKEIAVLKSLLPVQLSQEELKAAVENILSQYEMNNMDVGRAMSILMPKLKGNADGADVRAVVVKMLSGES